jgi:hypothetical protein
MSVSQENITNDFITLNKMNINSNKEIVAMPDYNFFSQCDKRKTLFTQSIVLHDDKYKLDKILREKLLSTQNENEN